MPFPVDFGQQDWSPAKGGRQIDKQPFTRPFTSFTVF